MLIVWLLVGIGAVSVAFFIPPNTPELWPALNAASIPMVLYLFVLVLYTLRSPISVKARIIAWVSVVLVGGACYSSWTGMDAQSHWQRNRLLEIHSVIIRGEMQAFIPGRELDVLEAYYEQDPKKKETLAKVFQRLNDGAKNGVNIYKGEWGESATMSIVVQSMSDNEVVLVGLHSYDKGRKAEFRNYNGKTGLIQEKYTLTEKGIIHESEN